MPLLNAAADMQSEIAAWRRELHDPHARNVLHIVVKDESQRFRIEGL